MRFEKETVDKKQETGIRRTRKKLKEKSIE